MLSLIIQREYYSRVKRKSFIITTILMPLLIVGLMLLPALLVLLNEGDTTRVEIIDNSGIMAKGLMEDRTVDYAIADRSVDSLKKDADVDAILVIGENIVANPNDVTLITRGAPSITLESSIKSRLSSLVEERRMEEYNIDNLREIVESVKADVTLNTLRIDGDEDRSTSSMLSYFTGIGMSFMLYMFIILYGQMVMTSIIEEKSNRVLELVVSSVNPKSLMMGKILGIGLVALTQMLIWAVLVCSFTTLIMPHLVSGVTVTTETNEMMSIVAELTSPGYILSMFAYLIIFLIGGYLFYSSIYAAVGSSVDNIQDASQLSSLAVIPIVLGMIVSPSVVQQPDSALAVWTSIIPLTSPMVMMARIPFGVPFWQIGVSIVLLYATFFGMVWLAAKIYRVGIFMYGKKPTLKDLARWARYK